MGFGSNYLFFNSFLCLGLGLTMYLKPKLLTQFWHTSSLSGESLALMSGWGSALIGLGYMAFSMGRSGHQISRKTAYGSLACMWAALCHGTWVMHQNAYFGQWNQQALLGQLLATGLLCAIGLILTFMPAREKLH